MTDIKQLTLPDMWRLLVFKTPSQLHTLNRHDGMLLWEGGEGGREEDNHMTPFVPPSLDAQPMAPQRMSSALYRPYKKIERKSLDVESHLHTL